MGPGLGEEELVSLQTGSLSLRGSLYCLNSGLTQLTQGGVLHRGQGLQQLHRSFIQIQSVSLLTLDCGEL